MIDQSIRHQVYLTRYAGGEVEAANQLLVKMYEEIKATLATANLDDKEYARLAAIFNDLVTIIRSKSDLIQESTLARMEELAPYEADFTRAMLAAATANKVAGVTVEQVMAAVSNEPMVLNNNGVKTVLTPSEAFTDFADTAARDVRHIIQSGIIQGVTTPDITDEIAALISSRTRRQAEALVRTTIAHTASVATNAVYMAHGDILVGVRYSATLDSRTSLLCASRDGNVYPVGKGPPIPAHWNCRSRYVPIVKHPLPGYDTQRASNGPEDRGPISGKITYGEWLKRQPDYFQDDVLGAERAKMFRDGQVSIDKFVDNSGKTLTLEQLRAKK